MKSKSKFIASFLYYLRTNWRTILAIFCLWIVLTLIFCLYSMTSDYGFSKPDFRAAYEQKTINGGKGSSRISLATINKYFLYGGFAGCFYLIVGTLFWNKILMKELTNKTISYWLSHNLSRTKILLYKCFFIFSIFLLLFLIQFTISLAFVINAYYISEAEIYAFISQTLNFLAFVLFINSLFFLIVNFWIEKQRLVNCIITGFLVLVILILFLSIFLKKIDFSYVNIFNLIYNPFDGGTSYSDQYDFSNRGVHQIINKDHGVIFIYDWKSIKPLYNYIIAISMILGTGVCIYGGLLIFQKKQIHC
ncbi:hypothetical protein [Spiroplasma endosymbiont of Aspidapion aeneum]|uniref:hypothetical protein n=1 Tax=Spiroplasma endosymbiont of Aspidapion aeneum TaxID=3066276 RepID=UPI00313DAC8C